MFTEKFFAMLEKLFTISSQLKLTSIKDNVFCIHCVSKNVLSHFCNNFINC